MMLENLYWLEYEDYIYLISEKTRGYQLNRDLSYPCLVERIGKSCYRVNGDVAFKDLNKLLDKCSLIPLKGSYFKIETGCLFQPVSVRFRRWVIGNYLQVHYLNGVSYERDLRCWMTDVSLDCLRRGTWVE